MNCVPSLANINVLRVCDLKLFLQIKHYISVRVHNLGILGEHKLDMKVGRRRRRRVDGGSGVPGDGVGRG